MQAATLGRADLSLVVIPHPLAGLPESEALERGRSVGREVLAVVDAMSEA
ncbi:MAG TPA: hypothetical protein VIJ58_12900 [Candidatus Dormibacteraeota bacterium]